MSIFVKTGALWLKEGKDGKYMAGEIEVSGEKIKIMVFKNRYKKTDIQPDYIVQRPVDDAAISNRQQKGGAENA